MVKYCETCNVLYGWFIVIRLNVCALVVKGCSTEVKLACFNKKLFCCVCRLGSLSKEHGTKTDTKKEEKEESAPDSNENDGKYCI